MFDSLWNFILIVLGFTLLIFVHELGHFLAAKWAGIRTQAFAIGMGPVVASWRKGIGFRAGNSAGDVERRVREYYNNSEIDLDDEKLDEDTRRSVIFRAMDSLGIGETEYSLRWLPIGGFVAMAGQEDIRPGATSSDPRSYQNCPVWKRMIVVSAGVVMNIILALALFVVVFMIGLPDPAPVVGGVEPDGPAANVVAAEAASLGITEPGLRPGDRLVEVDGSPIDSFQDSILEFAMAKPDTSLKTIVDRKVGGEWKQLTFQITPQKSPFTGLLDGGIVAAISTTLGSGEASTQAEVTRRLKDAGLWEAGVRPGMKLISVEGHGVHVYGMIADALGDSRGKSVRSTWTAIDRDGNPIGQPIEAPLPIDPQLSILPVSYLVNGKNTPTTEIGLIGFTPLVRVEMVTPDSANKDVLMAGDVFEEFAGVVGPRWQEFYTLVRAHPDEQVQAVVRRDGKRTPVTVTVNRKGAIGVLPVADLDHTFTARPIESVESTGESDPTKIILVDTPLKVQNITPLSRIVRVGEVPTTDWTSLRNALVDATQAAYERREGATVPFAIEQPTPGREVLIEEITLSAADVDALHELGWNVRSSVAVYFEREMVILSAQGNPIRAIGMGFEKTHKFILNVYLTIDRLIRGSVGVEQLRGPVGIVDLGIQVADRGFIYLIFLLAMISINLAVINFLPMPIVDGGLFLFLVYERFKGKPPSVAFQNWATIAGLALIVTLFLVVTYNDVARLITGG